jgi:hypothetical protein
MARKTSQRTRSDRRSKNWTIKDTKRDLLDQFSGDVNANLWVMGGCTLGALFVTTLGILIAWWYVFHHKPIYFNQKTEGFLFDAPSFCHFIRVCYHQNGGILQRQVNCVQ